MKFEYDDGGRAEAGYKVHTGDCVVRAIAIATGIPYQKVYDNVNRMALENEGSYRRSSSRKGVHTKREWFKDYLKSLGFFWTEMPSEGCKIHLRDGEVPMRGIFILCLNKHLTVVKNGIIYDTYDPSNGGEKQVKGYWSRIKGPSIDNPTQNFLLINNGINEIEEI